MACYKADHIQDKSENEYLKTNENLSFINNQTGTIKDLQSTG